LEEAGDFTVASASIIGQIHPKTTPGEGERCVESP
jgi:hypothetical protein